MKKVIFLFIATSSLVCYFAPSFAQGNIDFERISEEARNEDEENSELEREHLKWALSHRERVFGWNHISSVIIFFFVMSIITMGMYFSYMQFRESIHKVKRTDLPTSTMKIGHSGVEVSSSVIGLLILTVSLAFFYLYLENVYPVQTVPILTTPSQELENAPPASPTNP